MSVETASGTVPASAGSTGGTLLEAHGIEKANARRVWPLRRRAQVLRGADLTPLGRGEVVGLVGEKAPARAP